MNIHEVTLHEVTITKLKSMVYNFEELVIWQIARDLTQEIYSSLSEVKDFGFRDQIQRASISIMNNIAEGFQRHKNTKDNKTFTLYLNYAYGSCGEVKSMLYIAEYLKYIDEDICKKLRNVCVDLDYKIGALIKSLNP